MPVKLALTFTLDDILEALRKECEKTSQKDVAERMGVSSAYLSDVMSKRRSPGPKILAGLGMKKSERIYKRIE